MPGLTERVGKWCIKITSIRRTGGYFIIRLRNLVDHRQQLEVAVDYALEDIMQNHGVL